MEKEVSTNCRSQLRGHWAMLSALLLAFTSFEPSARANGINRNGVGAESMSMGGTETAWATSPLGAMAANPAGLGFQDTAEIDVDGFGAITEGHFDKPGVSSGDLDDSPNGLAEGAFDLPLKKWPVTLGISVIPDSLLLADWNYFDPPGNPGGITYGQQEHKSEIFVLRSAIGAGVAVNSKLSLGASLGLIYNENRLITPYTFQNLQPSADAPLDGAKTLLNLHTTGFGWNAQAGVIFRATTNLQFGLSYKSQTTVHTSGDASGDPYAQFGAPPGPLAFHYDAAVRNIFPQQVSAGMSWRFRPQWRLALQVDWLNWANAFHTLPVGLSNGNNPTVNSVLGSSFSDAIPLNWNDEFVYRAGLEYDVTENLALRGGYCYGHSPVPDLTLNPMTAAIMEHTLTAGIGYRWKRCEFDLAYQYDLPVTQNVGTSGLLAGEYSNSSTEVSVHWIALTARIRF